MLAGAAMAQRPDEQSSPKNKKQGPEKAHAAEAKPKAKAAKPQGEVAKQRGAVNERAAAKAQKPEAAVAKQRGAMNERAATKAQKAQRMPKTEKSAGAETNVSGQAAATSATPVAKQRGKGMKAAGANAKVAATPAPTAPASAAPPVSAASQQKGQAKTAAAAKKPAPEKVQQIKQQHANFRAQPKPQQVPAVTYQQNYRIQGSDQWQGRQYEVFRSYRPERHDRGWYRSRYNRVELIGGGYYYWNNGYWYPAWGYEPSAEYYAYDAPIYVGRAAEPPDRVIANVQAALQEMGYYKGEVDGLLGPLTREALTGYQADQGLTPTAMIDEPTLDALGMG
jgi:hypothetical protein